jgi:hypothetical protein
MVNEDWKDTNAMSSGVRRKNRTVRSTLKIFQEVRGVVTMVLRRHTNVCRRYLHQRKLIGGIEGGERQVHYGKHTTSRRVPRSVG